MRLSELLPKLPKTDLHVHLDGSVRLPTLLDLAREQHVDLGASRPEELAALVSPGDGATRSLEQYLRAFETTCAVLKTPEALRRVARELVEDAALENVRYMEVRYSPMLMTGRGVGMEDAVREVAAGLAAGGREYGVVTRQILCALRDQPPSLALEIARIAVRQRAAGVVALDLAGPEAGHPARAFAEAFEWVRLHDMHVTVHAGEADGPDSIRSAIVHCGAERIGHGTRLFEDPRLVQLVEDRGIPLEVCITSNVQTGAASSTHAHPVRAYIDRGLKVTLSTDNRQVSATTVTRELAELVRAHSIDVPTLRRLTASGFDAAFLPRRERESLRDKALGEFDALTAAVPA